MAESGLIIVDKPGEWTSHDVVAKMRRIAGTRRVGHAGTLDPMATGVLVVGVEKATRLLGHLMLTEKVYETTIRLGVSTNTDDAEGEVVATAPAAGVTEAEIHKGVEALTGEIMQVPPQVSAIKVNGERAYKKARAGEEVALVARPVTVRRFDVLGIRADGDVVDVDAVVTCSSGTYIRSLARDLGAALGVGRAPDQPAAHPGGAVRPVAGQEHRPARRGVRDPADRAGRRRRVPAQGRHGRGGPRHRARRAAAVGGARQGADRRVRA
ncbi:hypothetical protein GCM10020220_065590 [Nonomuraea rubra]